MFSHVLLGNLAQFAIDDRNHPVEGGLVPLAPLAEQLRHFITGRLHVSEVYQSKGAWFLAVRLKTFSEKA